MTALIGLAIIAIWLVVLVPMWLNRHDATDAVRSMDSFTTAMRVLSRRAPAQGDRRYVVMPRRDNWGVTVDNNPDAKAGRRSGGFRRPPVAGAAAAASRARVLARRRRLTLAVVTLVIVLAVTAALGLTSWWYELAIDLAAAGYLIHLRSEAIRARELRRRRLARAARAQAWRPLDEPRRRRIAAETFADADEALAPTPVSAAGTENGSRWEPVPVPLPTYVSKPVVSRPAASAPRADVDATTIDLTRPGAWSDGEIDHRHLLLDDTGSGRIAASPGAPAAPEAVSGAAAAAAVTARPGSPTRRSVEFEDDELDVILRRRAVGD